jgi:hypothetical protein
MSNLKALEKNPRDRLIWSDELKRLNAPLYMYSVVRRLIDELEGETGQLLWLIGMQNDELAYQEKQLAAGVEIVRVLSDPDALDEHTEKQAREWANEWLKGVRKENKHE